MNQSTLSLPAAHRDRRLSPGLLPRRAQIGCSTIATLRPGRSGHCDVLLVDVGGEPVVVKDYASRQQWLRLLGRFMTWYEHRAYLRLGPIAGIPRLIGRVDAHALALERVDGRPLVASRPGSEEAERCLAALQDLVEGLMARGFFHLDLRSRRNLMWRNDEVVALDLVGSLWLRPGSALYRVLRPMLAFYHRAAVLKWKSILTPGRLEASEEALLRRFRLFRALWAFNPKGAWRHARPETTPAPQHRLATTIGVADEGEVSPS